MAPDRDTAWYIHMAKQAREGGNAWLKSVFPPLHPWLLSLIGPFPGNQPEDWWFSAQILCSIEGALATGLLYLVLSRSYGIRLAFLGALTLGLSFVSCGTAADGMTEPLFQLVLVLVLGSWLSNPRAWLFPSLFIGILPLIRPEGLALLPWAWWLSWRRSPILTIPSLFLSLGPRAGYLYFRYQATGEASLFPKGNFMSHLSALSDGTWIQGLQHWGREAGQFFGQGFAGAGYLVWPLFFLGAAWVWRGKVEMDRRFRLPCLLLFLALLVVPYYHANPRFHATWLPLSLCIGLLPLLFVSARAQGLFLVLGITALVPSGMRLMRPRRTVLALERELGVALRTLLPKEAGIASDLPRLMLFAGRPPLPPRHITATELRALSAKKEIAAVVSLEKRNKLDPAFLRTLGYRSLSLSRLLGPEKGAENPQGLQLFIKETVMVK